MGGGRHLEGGLNMEVTGLTAFLIVTGTVAVVLVGSYFFLRLSAFCAGQEW